MARTSYTITLTAFPKKNLLNFDILCAELRSMGPSWSHFYQTRSAWSMDQGSNENHSPVNNFAPTVTKFCVMWEGQALPHDTKFGNCRDKIVDSKVFPSWSLIHGSSWSGLIKVEPDDKPSLIIDNGQGTISWRIFPSSFKFDGHFIVLSTKLYWSDCYEILHMPWQLCCHGMCKIL